MTAAPHPSGAGQASADQVRRFAYLQGPGKNLLAPPPPIDDDGATTTALPPKRARGDFGLPLPSGTCDLLDVAFPDGRATADAELVGHLLLAALGLQRRELDQPFADHRAVASGRARFPVHTLVVYPTSVRYLDHYRHALVDAAVPDTTPRQRRGQVRVVLAARYSDLPTGYQSTRAAVAEAELGIALRAITQAARLLGVGSRTVLAGPELIPAVHLVAACGPGVWSAPVMVELSLPARRRAQARSVRLPGPATQQSFTSGDALLDDSLADLTARQAARISATRLAVSVPALPITPDSDITGPSDRQAGLSWARVLANRSAGNAPGRRNGFSLRPTTLGPEVLTELTGWVGAASPTPTEITDDITVRVAIQRCTDRMDGLYRLVGNELVLERADDRLVRTLADRYGQHSSADTEIGLRHACAVWQISAHLDNILQRVGPAGWPMVQLHCGWLLHGLSLAAAAHGLVNRPTRSYDDHTIAQTLRLHRRDIPMFMSVCGRPAYVPLALDLRP